MLIGNQDWALVGKCLSSGLKILRSGAWVWPWDAWLFLDCETLSGAWQTSGQSAGCSLVLFGVNAGEAHSGPRLTAKAWVVLERALMLGQHCGQSLWTELGLMPSH